MAINNLPVSAELEVRFGDSTYRVFVEHDSVYGSDAEEAAVVVAQRAMNGFLGASGLDSE